MTSKITFTQETSPDADTIKAIESGLVAYNTAIAGYHNHQPYKQLKSAVASAYF